MTGRSQALIDKIGSWLLIIPSAIIGLVLFELVCLLLPLKITQHTLKYRERIVFFDGDGTIFRNQGDIFTYVPHNNIRNLTIFFSGVDFSVEYDYRFRTNNFGLVQDTDIAPDRESLLLLGNSFTEGQGAEPWFRQLSPEIDKRGYQGINGGLLATGFGQWLKLKEYLESENIRVKKIVVVFISQDYTRTIVNMPPTYITCLAALTLCPLDQSYFYRLPSPAELPEWIAKIRAARGPMTKIWLKSRLAELLPASHDVYKYLMEKVAQSGREEEASRAGELDNGPSHQGLKARRAIQEVGGQMFDGFNLCRLTVSDYYANDEHPNRAGYAKIESCVADVIREMLYTEIMPINSANP
jgi:hypothetical protein